MYIELWNNNYPSHMVRNIFYMNVLQFLIHYTKKKFERKILKKKFELKKI